MRILGSLVPDLRAAKWLSKHNSPSLKFLVFRITLKSATELVSAQKPAEPLSQWRNCASGRWCAILLNPHRTELYLHWLNIDFYMWKLSDSLGPWRVSHLCSTSYFNLSWQAPAPTPHESEYRELPWTQNQKAEEHAVSLTLGWWKSEALPFLWWAWQLQRPLCCRGPQWASSPTFCSRKGQRWVLAGCWGQLGLESHQEQTLQKPPGPVFSYPHSQNLIL